MNTRRNALKAAFGVFLAGAAQASGLRVVDAGIGDAADLDGQLQYSAINPGASIRIWIRVVNVGLTAWKSGGREGYGYVGMDGWASRGQANLWRDVQLGDTITFAETVTPPQKPGNYRYGFLITRYGTSIGPYFFIDVRVRQSRQNNPYCPGGYCDQCTAFAQDAMHWATGLWLPITGNAGEWPAQARSGWWTVGNDPEISSVIVMPYASGHQYSYWDPDTDQFVNTRVSEVGHVGWVAELYESSVAHVVDRNWHRDGRDGHRWIWVEEEPVSFIYSSH